MPPGKPAGNGHRAEPEGAPLKNHPLAGVIGAFRDDPEYDALLEQIKKHPLTAVAGSFAHDLPTLDAIMAGDHGRCGRITPPMGANENVP